MRRVGRGYLLQLSGFSFPRIAFPFTELDDIKGKLVGEVVAYLRGCMRVDDLTNTGTRSERGMGNNKCGVATLTTTP
jgi:hypothetical protein